MTAAGFQIAVLPGDGIGPEVIEVAVEVLQAAAEQHGVAIDVECHRVGGAAVDAEGSAISEHTFARCRQAGAILFGATGGPAWDHLTDHRRPGSALIRLRRTLDLCVNLRPVRLHPGLESRSSLRAEIARGCDLVIVRELAGGIYYGNSGRSGTGATERAHDTMVYTRAEITRVAHAAFRLAARRRGRLTSVDKANVLSSGRFWREVVTEVGAEYPEIILEHALVDSFALRLLQHPSDLDVVLAENLFGDILSDEAAALCGSIGLLPSASLPAGGAGGPALYEPVHGSAPDIAGLGVANPIGAILCVSLLFQHSLGRLDAAAGVSRAVDEVLAAGVLTADLGGSATTREVGDAVLASLDAGG
ncbi:MAG: 3-isopropylmalate dehydrogenase [Candidatus Dormibacteria bacterium]